MKLLCIRYIATNNFYKTTGFKMFISDKQKCRRKVVYMMFGRRFQIDTFNIENEIDKLHSSLAQAQAVIIGAGAGLSISAGFTYTRERLQKYFRDFVEKYGFQDMYSGGFYPFDSLEEYWAYWSRYIFINRYMTPTRLVYQKLYNLIKDKDYFVLTTNVDHCFQKAGFDKRRLFYTQGDYGLFQCSEPCHQKTYDNEMEIRQMIEQQKYMKIPTRLIPHCPICGKPMSMNLRSDNTFVEDEGWHISEKRYTKFLQQHRNLKVLLFELGTGMNTPGIIKFNFWRMIYEWKDATYACINLNEAYVPNEIRKKSICINNDIGAVLNKL